MVWPVLKFRLDAVGAAFPVGKTVRWPSLCGLATVTLSATALAPAGTPRLPAILVLKIPYPATWPLRVPRPVRVSTNRSGLIAV